jgi:hypothetical protein
MGPMMTTLVDQVCAHPKPNPYPYPHVCIVIYRVCLLA